MENLTDVTHRFHFEEFKALRGELEQRVSELSRIAQYSLIGVAAIFAWLAKEADPHQPGLVFLGLLGALLLSGGNMVRTLMLESRILELRKYLQSVEAKFGADGFESHSHVDSNTDLPEVPNTWSPAVIQQVILTFLTLIVAIYFLSYSLRVS